MSVYDEEDGIIYKRKNGKLNAGRPWTDEERMELERIYQDDMPMRMICETLQRRERGIRKQLAYLGLSESGVQHSGSKKPCLERAGLPWTRDEDVLLKDFYLQKFPLQRCHVKCIYWNTTFIADWKSSSFMEKSTDIRQNHKYHNKAIKMKTDRSRDLPQPIMK